MKINWGNKAVSGLLHFSDLDVNEAFRNLHGKGAVYTKVRDRNDNEYMYEIATGRLWEPTTSPVERVNVEVNIDQAKPTLRKY